MAWTEAYRCGGVTVRWDPDAGILHMAHGRDPALSDRTAWQLGRRMGSWIEGREGRVGAMVDAAGVASLPDDWVAYWAKVLHQGFVNGLAVVRAPPPFARAASDLARLTGVPFRPCADEAEARRFLAALPPVAWRGKALAP